jgi:ribosomal protein S18 acetylase RimI-like enzyme
MMPLGIDIDRLDITVDGVATTLLVASAVSIIPGHQSRVVGCVELLFQSRKSACIRQLYVHESWRRRGIGRFLVETSLKISALGFCETLGLSLAKENESGAAFYRKLGFTFAYQYDDGSQLVVKQCRAV